MSSLTFHEHRGRSLTVLTFSGQTPVSPASPIRVALHTCLQTSATQCDSIRQVFSPLTAPGELSQLSEMYAPASPSPFTLHIIDGTPGTTPSKHISSPSAGGAYPNLRMSRSTSTLDKRSTWSGAPPSPYSAPRSAGSFRFSRMGTSREPFLLSADAGMSARGFSSPTPSPSPSPTKRASAIFARRDLASAATTPSVEEEEDEDEDATFGTLALGLQKTIRRSQSQRYSQRLSLAVPPQRKSASARASPTSSSRFTTLQATPRSHPLSMASLHLTLRTAMASKRFACAHLLALRFESSTGLQDEEEEDSYWEDVRSVMALLITTFEDEGTRLSQSLERCHRSQRQDETPTTPNSPVVLVSGFADHSGDQGRNDSISFAPTPSHMSRYLAHARTISQALDDAKAHLEESIEGLKQLMRMPTSPMYPTSGDAQEQNQDVSGTLEAYNKLRQDLGTALRDCERARDPLLALLPFSAASGEGNTTGEETEPEVPQLAERQSQSSESGGLDSPAAGPGGDAQFTIVSKDGRGMGEDDASAELIASTSAQHLPPPGIESVFEAISSPPTSSRGTPDGKAMSRAERIAMVKAQRAEAALKGISASLKKTQQPGGEIVAELKRVITKVQERKASLAAKKRMSMIPVPVPTSPPQQKLHPHRSMDDGLRAEYESFHPMPQAYQPPQHTQSYFLDERHETDSRMSSSSTERERPRRLSSSSRRSSRPSRPSRLVPAPPLPSQGDSLQTTIPSLVSAHPSPTSSRPITPYDAIGRAL